MFLTGRGVTSTVTFSSPSLSDQSSSGGGDPDLSWRGEKKRNMYNQLNTNLNKHIFYEISLMPFEYATTESHIMTNILHNV